MHPYNFGTSGNILMKLFQATCRDTGVITCVQFLEGLPPWNLGGPKTSKFRRDFWQLSTLIAKIPGMGRHVKNLTRNWTTTTPPTFNKRKPVELWSTYEKVIEVHIEPPKWIFFCTQYFGPSRVLRPQIVTRAIDWPSLNSAHPNWDGGPPKKF